MRDLYLVDLKRILKDKLFRVTCILALVFAAINPILNKALFAVLDLDELLGGTVTAKSMLFSAFAPGDNLGIVMPILMAIVVCKDFSQGTVRNKIISGHSRRSVFLSHLASATTVICSVMLVHALLTLGISLFLFDYQVGAFTAADLGYLLISLVFEMLVYAAIAAIVTTIAALAKSTGLCILLYLAVSLGSTLIGAIFQAVAIFLPSDAAGYGAIELVNALNIFTSTMIGAGSAYTAKEILYILLAPVLIIVGCTALGLLRFERKDLK